jgi:transposase
MTDDEESARMAEVLRLGLLEGLSVRAIARRLSMSRKTVRRMLGRKLPCKRKPPAQPRTSALDPYKAEIRQMLADTPELRSPAILERLRANGYTGGITILRDLVRTLRPRPPTEAFLTLDFKPGATLQVDWADFGFAIPGCPRRVSGFIAVLSYSRYLYLEFKLSQAMGTFLRCMERALAFYGGTTHVDIFDNMKTVVRERKAGATLFNARFLQYSRARDFGITACTPGKGNQKGRVERPIGFVRERFWRGRRFADLFDLNVQATQWRDDFANNRVHEVTGKVPSLVFDHEERRLLKPLPQSPFETDDIDTARVTKSFRVSFDRNLYSVPWRLVSQSVLVRGTDEVLTIFLGKKEVARHARCWSVGEDIQDPRHEEGLLQERPRAPASSLPASLVGLGDLGRDYFKVLAANGASIHREVVRLVFLVELFGEGNTKDAMLEVMKTGHIGAEYVEYVLRHRRKLDPAPAPVRLGDPELDDINFREPDLSLYDELIPSLKTTDPGDPPEEDPPDEEGR